MLTQILNPNDKDTQRADETPLQYRRRMQWKAQRVLCITWAIPFAMFILFACLYVGIKRMTDRSHGER